MMVKNLFLQLLLSYAIFTVILYFVSDFGIFPAPKSSYKDTLEFIKIKMRTGEMLTAIYFLNPNAKVTVLFSHGNAEDLGVLLPYLETYFKHGFSILAYDYPGYGTSEGRPSEQKTYQAIEAVYDYLINYLKVPAKQIILHGRSLGTGPTIDLAIRFPAKGIILESPMLTAFRVVTGIPLFPVDKFRNNAKIQKISAPMLFIHGTQDEVIPFWHGQKLYEMAKGKKYFFAVQGAGHNDIAEIAGERYWNAIRDFENLISEKIKGKDKNE